MKNIRKFILSGVIALSAAAILNIVPANSAAAAASSNCFGDDCGMSSLLSVLGNSYEVDTMDSDMVSLVTTQAEELNIELDLSEYENEYSDFAIAKCDSYVNVRDAASTDGSVVGHMYNGSVCQILEKVEADDGEWFRILSGSVEGYVKSEYFIYGKDALDVIEDYVTKVAVVQCNVLNVRAAADANAAVIGSVRAGDKLDLVEQEDIIETVAEIFNKNDSDSDDDSAETADASDKAAVVSDYDEEDPEAELATIEADDDTDGSEAEDAEAEEPGWIEVQYTSNTVGYVSAEYVVIEENYVSAKTIEEEKAEAEAKAAAEKKRQQAAAAAAAQKEDTTFANVVPSSYSTTSELRQSLVDYALSFVGNRYVMGGGSLSSGTDCSGFTCYVYAAYGYSIGRTPSSQWSSAGRYVSYDELQPGDIVCFGTSSCYHVAIYIGNGQIVHEANSRSGCIISGINFEPILGYKNVID